MHKQATVWKEATWIFLLSRVVILLVAYLTVSFVPMRSTISPVNYIPLKKCDGVLNCFVLAWWHTDAIHYVEVAYVGYAHHMPLSVFFPLFPLLIRGLGTLFGGSIIADYVAGLVIANLCFYAALMLFYQLLHQDFGHTVARYALIYLAFAPYGLFFFAGYAESLFLLLSLAVFFFLHRGQALDWWLAGLCGGLAALTRPTGIVLIVPFGVLFVQKFIIGTKDHQQVPTDADPSLNAPSTNRTVLPSIGAAAHCARGNAGRAREDTDCTRGNHRWCIFSAIFSMALVPAGLLIYMCYLWITFGNPLVFCVEEAAIWLRYAAFPWVGTFDAIRAIVGLDHYFYSRDLADVAFTLVPLIALIAGWKQLPLHYSLYCAAMVLFVLCEPCQYEGLLSVPRFLLVLFPIVIIFALYSKRSRLTWQLMILCGLFFVVYSMQFASANWVA
jgi:hypothetical protein